MTETRVIAALAEWLNWDRCRMYPNVMFGGGECDLLRLSSSDYATEYEIKLTKSDWAGDGLKTKWMRPERRFITSFYYVVPVQLIAQKPAHLRPEQGIISFNSQLRGLGFKTEREAGRTVYKVTDEQRRGLDSSLYYRYWRQKLGG